MDKVSLREHWSSKTNSYALRDGETERKECKGYANKENDR